ncbi:unnamed protein product [Somion occarium]|uniref:Mitochondrial carrier protein n=1 Tax=Somion occarium TaxID=3059160 RepID=A0ABP1D6E0_9APHY
MSVSDAVDRERQPLLTKAADDPTLVDENTEGTGVASAGSPPEKKRSWWSIGWYTVATVVGLFLLAIFIKGFIDADDVDFDLKKALMSALGGGLSGAAAMILQVLTLMPIRTVMNYQYRYGTHMTTAIKTLHADGGWTRYYQGLTAALIQGPVARFGDTAANAGILALLQSNSYMKKLPALIKTIFASLAAAGFRMILTPIDTVKTTLQTQGKAGWPILKTRVRTYGIGTLWYGAVATAAATFVGHYPWFATYNILDVNLPQPTTIVEKFVRQAFIGFCASVISDTISNSLRVVKTYRQVNETRIGYFEAAEAVIATDGLKGLFGRGLKTRILANGLQGLMFSVLWKLFLDIWNDKTK